MVEEINVKERIKEIEKFLGEEEASIIKAPFEASYRSNTGIFKGQIQGNIDLPIEEPTVIPTIPTIPPPPAPIPIDLSGVIILLSRIIANQDLERMRWERCNPLATDSPVYDWAEATIDPGYIVVFTLTIPEGSVFFFEYFNISYNPDTTYNIYIDSVGPATFPALAEVMQDFGDHNPFFKPPRLCYNNVEITALNNGIIAQTYSAFVRGFFRQQIKTDKDYLGGR